MRDHVLLPAGILDVYFKQIEIQQISHAESPATHLIFVGRTNTARGGANLYATGCILRGELDHPVIGKNHVGTIAYEEIAVHLHPGLSQSANFFQEGHGIKHDAITDHTTAARTENATRHELQNEFLAVDDDGMPGIVSAGITRDYGELFREDVDNFPFAFIAPLGAYDDRSLTFPQITLQDNRIGRFPTVLRGAHTCC